MPTEAENFYTSWDRWIAARHYPTADGGVSTFFQDITERKQAEQQLRRSEQELADFFENATVGLHWVGPDGIILRANRAELNLLGYAADEYVGHHIAEFHADQGVIGNILRRLTAGEELHDYESRLRCKDGSVRHVLISSNVLWEDDRFVHTRCFTRDITDRKQAEEALRESEQETTRAREYAEATLRTSPVPLLVLEKDLRVNMANEAFHETFQVDTAETQGRLVYELGNGQWNIPELRELLESILSQHAVFKGFEVTREFESIGRRTMLLNARRMDNEPDMPERIVLVIEDITERQQAEERLAQFAAELEQRVFERTHELAQSEDRLRTLATELNLAEQRERKRLATELHDYLQQILVLGRLTIGQGKRVAAGMPRQSNRSSKRWMTSSRTR